MASASLTAPPPHSTHLLELEDLVEALVKQHEKTLVEAAAVVHVTMQCAASLTAKLQQRYPSLQGAADVLTVLADKMPAGFQPKMAATIVAFWEREQTTGTYAFVPGVFVAEFHWVASALASFTSVISSEF